MSRVAPPPVAPVATPAEVVQQKTDAVQREHETRNFLALIGHQVMLRVGWIFKTESIVMPAFLSYIGGGSVLLGMLPVLNRLGFSIPPLLFARRLKITPRKKRAVALTTLGMAVPFAVLSALWFSGIWQTASGEVAGWVPWLFLTIYGLFFCLTGMNQLGSHSLQGKLIRPDLRGRLFMASVLVGSPVAILAAWTLLPAWLALPDGGFGWLFGFTALAFVVSAAAVTATWEAPDDFREETTNPLEKLHNAWQVVRSSTDSRGLSLLAALASANLMLFPHYQALGRDEFGLGLESLGLWVCVQNVATALYSLVAGPLADRFGNRAALRLTVFGLCLAPLLAITLTMLPTELGRSLFWLVFIPIGFTPVTIRVLINYALEIAPRDEHPKFVSAIGMCLAIPVIIGSPIVGVMIRALGPAPVFAAGLLVLLIAGGQTFWLSEPRHADTTA